MKPHQKRRVVTGPDPSLRAYLESPEQLQAQRRAFYVVLAMFGAVFLVALLQGGCH